MALEKFYFGEDTNSSTFIEKLNKAIDEINKFQNFKVHGANLSKTPSSYILNVKKNQISRPTTSTSGTSLYIYRIVSMAYGNGSYNCYKQKLDATDWNSNDTNKRDKLDDLNSDSVIVFNLAENGLVGQALAAGDLLIAWDMQDDEGTSRLVGVPAGYAWWHA
jgi:hypothetical protein